MNVLRLVLYICSVACSVHACVHWSLLTCFSTCSESLRLLKLDVKKTQHKSALPMVVNITASTSRKPDEYLVCKRLWPLYEFPPQTMHYYCATITCILSLIDPQKIGKLMTPERMSQENTSEMNCFIFQANSFAQKNMLRSHRQHQHHPQRLSFWRLKHLSCLPAVSLKHTATYNRTECHTHQNNSKKKETTDIQKQV